MEGVLAEPIMLPGRPASQSAEPPLAVQRRAYERAEIGLNCNSAVPHFSQKGLACEFFKDSRQFQPQCKSESKDKNYERNSRAKWQKRREPGFRLPFNLIAFYEFVGCGGRI